MIAVANARGGAFPDTHEILETPPRRLRPASRIEREELDAILPWGLGGVIETVATTLDEIISDAMDRGAGRTGPEDGVERAAPSSSSPSLSSSSPWPVSSSSHVLWSISWNDIFGDDTEDEDVAIEVTDLPSTPQRDGTEMQKLQKELRRCKSQNGRMKKKIAALEAQLAHRSDDVAGARRDSDEEVVTMQIEHLLAQKTKLGYENDSLKRENKRLEELVDYFLGTTSCGERCDESDSSDSTTYSYSLE